VIIIHCGPVTKARWADYCMHVPAHVQHAETNSKYLSKMHGAVVLVMVRTSAPGSRQSCPLPSCHTVSTQTRQRQYSSRCKSKDQIASMLS
jgi:hypothetical protein